MLTSGKEFPEENQSGNEAERIVFLDFLRLISRMADLVNIPKVVGELGNRHYIEIDFNPMVLGTNITLFATRSLSAAKLQTMFEDAQETMRQTGISAESRDLIWSYFEEIFNCYGQLQSERAAWIASQLFRSALSQPTRFLSWQDGYDWDATSLADLLTACKNFINICSRSQNAHFKPIPKSSFRERGHRNYLRDSFFLGIAA